MIQADFPIQIERADGFGYIVRHLQWNGKYAFHAPIILPTVDALVVWLREFYAVRPQDMP